MMLPNPSTLLLLALLPLQLVSAQERLTPESFYQGIQDGRFDAVVDVRRTDEWEDGHIENATFVENLASIGIADSLFGCENCTIAVYCRSGNRAGDAIIRLRDEYGFTGELLNGLGVTQWVNASYPLVTDSDSLPAPCSDEAGDEYVCKACDPCEEGTESPEGSPTMAPSALDDSSGSRRLAVSWALSSLLTLIAWSYL